MEGVASHAVVVDVADSAAIEAAAATASALPSVAAWCTRPVSACPARSTTSTS